jgi:putative transposase
MTSYRRVYVPGGTYFFTVNLHDRTSDLLVRHIDALRKAVARTQRTMPFTIDAWVVLPDHLHTIWTLPPDDADFPGRWRSIKAGFSRLIKGPDPDSPSRRNRGERGIWQRRYWEHVIRDDRDYERHMDYIHFNPVKHGLVKSVADWEFSTFHRSIQRGQYPPEWAERAAGIEGTFGERDQPAYPRRRSQPKGN